MFGKQDENSGNPGERKSNDVQIIITMDSRTGQVTVSGPFANKILCYGLLGIARSFIDEFKGDLKMAQMPNGIKAHA